MTTASYRSSSDIATSYPEALSSPLMACFSRSMLVPSPFVGLASNNMWHGSLAFLVGEVILSIGHVCGLSHPHWFMDHPILAYPFP
jgi:hypothetical protein